MTDAPLPETCCPHATVWVQLGCAAYLGPSLRLRAHSGSVHCFALGVDAPFTVHVDGAGERRVRSALIPARTRHQLADASGRMAFVYVDPGSPWLTATTTRMTGGLGPAILVGHEDETELARRLRATPNPMRVLALPTGTDHERDERIRTALELLRTHPSTPWTAARLAAEVHLSPSRFQHLFTACTGTSFRRYRLWARMLRVASMIADGSNLTNAAVDAGFASPGHFSDTFAAMFGTTAGQVFTATTRVHVGDHVSH